MRASRRIDGAIRDGSLEAIVVAIQTRLGMVGWARGEPGVLTWKSAAAGQGSVPLEARLVRDDEGATLALSSDMESPKRLLVAGAMLATVGLLAAVWMATSTRGASWTLALTLAVPVLVAVPLATALVTWRRRRIAQELERAAELLASDVRAVIAKGTPQMRVGERDARAGGEGDAEEHGVPPEQVTAEQARGVSR